MHDTILPTGRGPFSAAAEARTRLLELIPGTERRLELAGISTPVIEGGEGPPLVLLHGPGESLLKWLPVFPGLVRTHRVVAPDLPGHGASTFTGSLDVERTITWLGELVERTCPSPPALVGQVVGGAIAARFAAAHGDRVRALILADTLGLAPFQPAPEFGAALMAYVSHPDEATYDALWARCAYDLPRLRTRMGSSWDRLKTFALDRVRTGGVGEAQHALMEAFGMAPIPEAELAAIRVPTALIWGREDLATPLAVAEAASARYGWPLHVIDGAGDDPGMERPEAFVAAVGEILAAPDSP